MKFIFPLVSCLLGLFAGLGCGPGEGRAQRSALPFPAQVEGLDSEVLARFQAAYSALEAAPDSQAAWMHLGMTYEAHSYMRLALRCYGAAVELGDDARARQRMSIALAAEGDLPAAVEAIQRSIALQPDYAPSQLLLGSHLFDQGHFDDAYRAYERGRALDPLHLGGALGMARVELQRSEPMQAIRLLEENLKLKPNEPSTRRLLHTAYLHAGQPEQAAALKVKWHSFPSLGSDPWAREFAAYAAPPVMERAYAEISRGNGALAVELLEPFVKANPDETNARAHLAWAYHVSGRTAQALDLLDSSIELYPTDLLLLPVKAQIFEALGKLEEALALTARMLEVDSKQMQALVQRARLLAQLKQPEQAIQAYQEVLALDRSRMELWVALGNVQLKTEQWLQAGQSFDQALSLKPGAEAPFLGSMHVKWKLGDGQAARAQLERRKNLGAEGRLLLLQIGEAEARALEQ